MSTVNGKFVITLNGVEKVIPFVNAAYTAFWLAQFAVLAELNRIQTWGLAPVLGQEPPFTGDTLGDVSYSYTADFSAGGSSEGSNEWHGIPQAGAEAIAAALEAAAAPLVAKE